MKMKFSLIFPPYVSLSCVPIGIASLKAYIEKYMPGVSVNLMDLNISFIDKILDGRLNDLSRAYQKDDAVRLHKNDKRPFQNNILKEQREIFKKVKGITKNKGLFFDREIFEKYIVDCSNYIFAVNKHIIQILQNYIEEGAAIEEAVADIFKDEIERIVSERPAMVGFSVLVEDQIVYALALARIVKQKLKIPVIFGGPDIFNFNLEEFMAAFTFVDFIIIKEGEKSIVELLKNMDGGNYENIPNLIWRKGTKVVINDIGYLEDLDMLPTPNFEGLELKEYFYSEIILPVASSRGCPWLRCRFCPLNAQYSGPYRERSVDRVIKDISYLKKRYGAANFFFTDSEVSARRLKELGRAIIKSKLKIYFACYARPTKNLNLDTLKIVHRAGGRFFQLGVESFSDRFLRFVRKGTSAESIQEVLKNTNKLKINNLVYMLACVPSQTRRELLTDLKKISAMQKRYNILSVVYCLYFLGPHQPFYDELRGHGLVVRPKEPYFVVAKRHRVHRLDCQSFSYAGRWEYDILKGPGRGSGIYSYWDAESKLDLLRDKFKLNSGNKKFLFVINNFFFETQLLYSGKNKKPRNNSRLKEKILRFYKEKQMELCFNIYKIQVRGYKVDRYGVTYKPDQPNSAAIESVRKGIWK